VERGAGQGRWERRDKVEREERGEIKREGKKRKEK
jgi:hypothetical protein